MATSNDKDTALKRLGGGRWQTHDARFTIEPQSGTWAVVDAEQTDDLGLPLVRGPFGSLRDAKEAIAVARASEPATSPLAARVKEGPSQPSRSTPRADRPRKARTATTSTSKAETPAAPVKARKPEEPAEPRWLTDLEPDERRRARRLIERLTGAGARDPVGIVRRDVVGQVPAAAAFALARKLRALGPDATPASVARLVAEGRDDDIGVRWRLVDEEGRSILLDLDD